LAKEVKALGYGIDIQPNGTWEIAGVPRETITNFSKRTDQIDQAEDKIRSSNRVEMEEDAVLRNRAVLESRKAKNREIGDEELKFRWESEDP
jgi:conjugative relaxase-like TrwC/TraI family protein